MIAALAPKEKSAPVAKLFDRIGTYFDSRHGSGRDGLVLLDECIRRAASKDRDWDALARFISRSAASNSNSKVLKIVRAAFGNAATYKRDTKHKAGGTFTLSWEGAFPLSGSNTYSVVKNAIVNSKSWDDKDFLLALSKVVPNPMKTEKTIDDAAQIKVVKHLSDYLTAREAEGFSTGDIMAALGKALAAKKVADRNSGVVKRVVNGVEVFDIGH